MRHEALEAWVQEVARYTRPEHIHYCDGSEAERDALYERMCSEGQMPGLLSRLTRSMH